MFQKWPGRTRAEETRQVPPHGPDGMQSSPVSDAEPCDAAAREGFKEGPGWVPYNTATSKNLLLLRPGNTPG